MRSATQHQGQEEFTELPNLSARSKDDVVFESAGNASARQVNAAISEDFGARLHEAQEKLLDLRHQQDQLERQRSDLQELQAKQDRFLKGRVDVVESLNKGLTRLDRDTFQARKRLEMLDHAKQNFGKHLDTIEALNPEHWSRADLRNELVRATAALEDAEQDYAEAMARLGMSGAQIIADSGIESPGIVGRIPSQLPDFRYWLMAGAAFTLPIFILGLLAMLLHFFLK